MSTNRSLVKCCSTGTYFTVWLCFTQPTSPLTSTITTVGRVCIQHPIFQLWRKFTIWWESSRHRSIHYTMKRAYYQSVLKEVTKCASISASASSFPTKFLKAVTRRLVGLCLPSLNRHSESFNSIVPPSTSANCASDISSGIFHGGWYKVFLIYLYASSRFATRSLVSATTSPPTRFYALYHKIGGYYV